jgi:hypothetical protein
MDLLPRGAGWLMLTVLYAVVSVRGAGATAGIAHYVGEYVLCSVFDAHLFGAALPVCSARRAKSGCYIGL